MGRVQHNSINGTASTDETDPKNYDYAINDQLDIPFSSDGRASFPVTIYNDARDDGDNLILLKFAPTGVENAGFSSPFYEFQEGNAATYDNGGTPLNLELTTSSQIRTAVVLIVDDEIPNNRIQGNEQSERIDGVGRNDTIFAGRGDDTVDAGGGEDIVFGGNGTDILDGGSGIDFLIGGNGNDMYIVDDPEDKIIDSRETGIETVRASVSYSLGIDLLEIDRGLDHLILTGSNNINGTGNLLDNRITGNNGDNLLEGKEGRDVLTGLGGNDALIGGDDADIFLFNSRFEGIDTIQDFNHDAGDRIHISGAGFFGTSSSSISQFSYNSTNGALLFDSPFDLDGPVQFATLQSPLNFNSSVDIVFV